LQQKPLVPAPSGEGSGSSANWWIRLDEKALTKELEYRPVFTVN
jgi:hypothetical protein